MTLNVGTTYSMQNLFTLNLVGQIPGGPGGSGFCAWAGLTDGLGGMIGWNLAEHGANSYQLINAHFGWVIAGHPNGDVFIYNGGFSQDQVWTVEEVADQPSVYKLKNSATQLYAYDPSGCGVTGVPRSTATIDQYNDDRFFWRFAPV